MTFERFEAVGMIEFQVVEEGQVHYLTQRGWRLVAVVADQKIEYANEQVPVAPPNPSGDRYNHPYTQTVQKPHVLNKTRYLMGLDADTTIQNMRQEIEAARSTTATANTEKGAAEEKARKLESDLKMTKDVAKEVSADLGKHRERVRIAEELRRKLEGDIAKLRTAIGDLRMREILEPK